MTFYFILNKSKELPADIARGIGRQGHRLLFRMIRRGSSEARAPAAHGRGETMDGGGRARSSRTRFPYHRAALSRKRSGRRRESGDIRKVLDIHPDINY